MDIKLGIGIGELKFGMSQKECSSILGEPNRIINSEDNPDETILEFHKYKIRLSFYKEEDGKLGYIRTANPEVNINGKALMNESIEQVKTEILKGLISDWDTEQNDYFTIHSNEKNWLILNEEYGAISDLELGVPINELDEYNWPA